jgi:hypothetical protein
MHYMYYTELFEYIIIKFDINYNLQVTAIFVFITKCY